MIHLTSISGPELHGKGRYKVENPAPPGWILDSSSSTNWSLSGKHVMLDGEVVFVHRVAHAGYGPRTDRTLILVTKPLRSKRYVMKCADINDVDFLRKIYDADATQSDNVTMDVLYALHRSLPRNLVRAKLYRLIARGYAYGYADDAGRILGYQLTGKGDQLVEKWYGHEIR